MEFDKKTYQEEFENSLAEGLIRRSDPHRPIFCHQDLY